MPTSKDNPSKQPKLKFSDLLNEPEAFDLQKYLENPYMIEQLYRNKERTISYINNLSIEIETLQLEKQQMQLLDIEKKYKLDGALRELSNVQIDLDNIRTELKEKQVKIDGLVENYHKLELEKNEAN